MRAAVCVSIAFGLIALSSRAGAYCRTTTCEPDRQTCPVDDDGCGIDGVPVSWSSDCLSISVQADAAPKAGVDYAEARGSVERAFAAWMNVTCPGGGHPSFHVEMTEPVTCSRVEYESDKRNANIVMFRQDAWPYAGKTEDALGYTRIKFDRETGELYDADIEINAVSELLAVGREPTAVEVDLDSVITHEVGHLLGLSHSLDPDATMI